jgi:hypothetical protein
LIRGRNDVEKKGVNFFTPSGEKADLVPGRLPGMGY